MRVLDGFAGSGWGVAVHRLGWTELGIETMKEAIQTRQKLGWSTFLDEEGNGVSMADLPGNFGVPFDAHIMSPPCQTFSMAGNGAGRQALTTVLEGVKVVASGEEFRPPEGSDPRTWLVLEPLRLALHSRPTYLFWEQVPHVAPVWEACAEVLIKAHGYSVWTGDLTSEMYGVPQTRKRRFLVGRLDGVTAHPPRPTHSRYYSKDPSRMDPGVLPWVSMAEALGWGTTGRPGFTVTGGGSNTGGAEPFGQAPLSYRSTTMPNATVRDEDQPAPTIAFGNDAKSAGWVYRNGTNAAESIRITVAESAVLQTFPADHPFQGNQGKQYLQVGNAVPPLLAEAVLRTVYDD